MIAREWQKIKDYDDIKFEYFEGIAKITINRPEVYNAFRPQTNFEMLDAMSICRERNDIGVIILTGAGDKAFCSGGDQKVKGLGGYIDENGYAYITGRKKNVIITKNGKNVYPEELEYQLSLSPYIEESFVFSSTQPGESDISIVASIRPDMEFIREELPTEPTDQDIKTILWEEVDKINKTAPLYRRIKKLILRKKEFIKNTSNKLVRFAEENKVE